MKIAIEIFSMIIGVTLACILFASIINSSNQDSRAKDYYNVVVNRIEDSNCNDQIINECVNDAKKKGYDLSVKDVTIYEDQPSKYITLTYYVDFAVFSLFGSGYEKQAMIEGYAR